MELVSIITFGMLIIGYGALVCGMVDGDRTNKDIVTINPTSLERDVKTPSKAQVLNFDEKAKLPSKPGVYFITKKDDHHVLYVGSAKNIKKRLASHETAREINSNYNGCDIHWLLCKEQTIGSLEQQMITRFKPPYNKTRLVTR